MSFSVGKVTWLWWVSPVLVAAQILQSEIGFKVISVVVIHSLDGTFATQTLCDLQVAQQNIYTGVGVSLWTHQYCVGQWAPNGVEWGNKTWCRFWFVKRVIFYSSLLAASCLKYPTPTNVSDRAGFGSIVKCGWDSIQCLPFLRILFQWDFKHHCCTCVTHHKGISKPCIH